VKLNRYKSAV